MLEVKVKCVLKEPLTTRYLMLLETNDEGKLIKIYIGSFEAEAIYTKLNGIKPPKPMTYDFFSEILESIKDVKIESVVIDDTDGEIYSASVNIRQPNGEVSSLQCRPSDAVALALRQKTPLFIKKDVIKKAKCIEKDCICDTDRELLETIIADQETSYWNV